MKTKIESANQREIDELVDKILSGHQEHEEKLKGSSQWAHEMIRLAWTIGNDLDHLKKLLPYGKFTSMRLEWFPSISAATSSRYLRIARARPTLISLEALLEENPDAGLTDIYQLLKITTKKTPVEKALDQSKKLVVEFEKLKPELDEWAQNEVAQFLDFHDRLTELRNNIPSEIGNLQTIAEDVEKGAQEPAYNMTETGNSEDDKDNSSIVESASVSAPSTYHEGNG